MVEFLEKFCIFYVSLLFVLFWNMLLFYLMVKMTLVQTGSVTFHGSHSERRRWSFTDLMFHWWKTACILVLNLQWFREYWKLSAAQSHFSLLPVKLFLTQSIKLVRLLRPTNTDPSGTAAWIIDKNNVSEWNECDQNVNTRLTLVKCPMVYYRLLFWQYRQ